ncbi:MAG: heme exporter protein CcmB [Polyangiaceae bacterium]
MSTATTPSAPLSRGTLSWWGQAQTVLAKDVRIELRSGEVVTTSGFFAVLLVVMASFSLYGGPMSRRLVVAAVVWLSVAFAAVLALGRAWQRERDESAMAGLVVSPLSPSALFCGKAVALAGFLVVIECLVIPLASLLFAVDLLEMGPGLLLIALCATPGVAATGTLFGAMTVRTRARDLMLAVVLFPLLSPTLLSAVAGTRELLGGASLAELGDYFRLMGVFDLVFIAGGLALFGLLLED